MDTEEARELLAAVEQKLSAIQKSVFGELEALTERLAAADERLRALDALLVRAAARTDELEAQVGATLDRLEHGLTTLRRELREVESEVRRH